MDGQQIVAAVVSGVVLILGAVFAFLLKWRKGEKKKPKIPMKLVSSPQASTPPPPAPAPAMATAGGPGGFEGRGPMDTGRWFAMQAANEGVDLKEFAAHVKALAEQQPATNKDLSDAEERLGNRIDEVSGSVESVRQAVGGLSSEVKEQGRRLDAHVRGNGHIPQAGRADGPSRPHQH